MNLYITNKKREIAGNKKEGKIDLLKNKFKNDGFKLLSHASPVSLSDSSWRGDQARKCPVVD